jgi:methylenetetrahydrofolate dehydrogenase (NADP+)/methenyltetrahydrofolate cyclohydrolase
MGKSSILLIVQVGDNKESEKYVSLKQKLAEKLGIKTEFVLIDPKLSDKTIFEKVKTLFKDKKYSGGIIQLPLPRTSLNKVLEFIPANKDIDLLSPSSQESFYKGNFAKLPPVIKALDYFITNNRVNLYGDGG